MVDPHPAELDPAFFGQVFSNREAYFENHREHYDCEENRGKAVLMSDGEFVGLFDTDYEACRIGTERFGIGGFSSHVIRAAPAQLSPFLTLYPAD